MLLVARSDDPPRQPHDRKVRAVELNRIIYNGHWFMPKRGFVRSAIPASQQTVNGVVSLKLCKGNIIIEGCSVAAYSPQDRSPDVRQTNRSDYVRINELPLNVSFSDG